ncbi:unnamed protein product [Pleuronectes platessa]|uniref:Uncharacterized protein n=1 Tax=Pleuronectes platessa TaxID=8262 RepID=A0A9N7YTJ5_PLEPL|nr:unnamed protein product [Pleuronectes platessa]
MTVIHHGVIEKELLSDPEPSEPLLGFSFECSSAVQISPLVNYQSLTGAWANEGSTRMLMGCEMAEGTCELGSDLEVPAPINPEPQTSPRSCVQNQNHGYS